MSRTSQAVRLDYYALQGRMAGGERDASGEAAEFVEFVLPAAAGGGSCEVVADQGRVRVRVSGLSPKDLASFVRAVVGSQEP